MRAAAAALRAKVAVEPKMVANAKIPPSTKAFFIFVSVMTLRSIHVAGMEHPHAQFAPSLETNKALPFKCRRRRPILCLTASENSTN